MKMSVFLFEFQMIITLVSDCPTIGITPRATFLHMSRPQPLREEKFGPDLLFYWL